MNNYYMFKEFNKYLIDKRISKPHKNSRYSSQGITEIDGNIFITYYDTDKLKNSIVDIIGKNGFITLELDNKSHVGGITYSDLLKEVYISNNGFINTYKLDDIRDLNNGETLRYNNKIKVHESVGIASYLTIFNNNLYVGRFDKDKFTKLAIYNLSKDGVTFNRLIDVPFKKVQGMCIYKFNNTVYYIFSRSYGRRNTSSITIARLSEDKFVKIREFFIPSMSEQISVSGKSLMIVFESDCTKFNENFFNSAKTRINNVIYLDIEKMLTDC